MKSSSKKVIKKFNATVTISNYSETEYVFKAVIYPDRTVRKFCLLTTAKKYNSNGSINCEHVNMSYFDNIDDLKKEFDYHYFLMSKNTYTRYIKVIIN